MPKLPRNDRRALLAALQKDIHAASGADLSKLDFEDFRFDGQLFISDANLTRSNFRRSKLRGVAFTDSDLSGSDFSGAVLEGITGDGARFAKAILEGAVILDSVFTCADFTGVRAKKMRIERSGLPDRFVDADLREAKLAGGHFHGDATRADLSGADLTGATLEESVFRDARFVGARLGKAEIEKCDFRGADLTGAELAGAKFAKCLWDERTRWPGAPPKGTVWKGKGKPPAGASVPAPPGAKPPSLKPIGEVGTWGDPLLILDGSKANAWTGSGDDGKSPEYRRACKAIAKQAVAPFEFGGSRGVLWDLQGEGTVYAFRTSGGLALVRIWIDDAEEESEAAGVLAAMPAGKAKASGTVALSSGVLAVLASAWDARRLRAKVPKKGVASLGDDSEALLVALPKGTYGLSRDEVKRPEGSAIRLFLSRRG